MRGRGGLAHAASAFFDKRSIPSSDGFAATFVPALRLRFGRSSLARLCLARPLLAHKGRRGGLAEPSPSNAIALLVAGVWLALASPASALSPVLANDGLDGRLAAALADGGFAADVAVFEAAGEGRAPGGRAAIATLRALAAVEGLARGWYAHGFRSPRQTGLPLFRMPLPENPQPTDLSYDGMRAILARMIDELDRAARDLEAAGRGDEFGLVIDLSAVTIDLSPEGSASGPRQSLPAILMPTLGPEAAAPRGGWTFRFDRADALWLAGYCELLATVGDLLLAHDFSGTHDVAAHHFFAGARTPIAGAPLAPDQSLYVFDGTFADAIAGLHLLRWPVVEPERRARLPVRLRHVVALSRATFDAAAAETDDTSEWLPSPKQTQWSADTPITDVQVAAWRGLLDEADALLDGRLLVPHWRFSQGIDLGALLAGNEPFDPWLYFTGHGTLPYLKEGPILNAERWGALTAAFGGRFGLYALYFN